MNLIRACISAALLCTTASAITHITPPDYFRTEDAAVLVGFAPAKSEPVVDAFKEPEFYRTTFYIHRIPNLNDQQHPPDDTDDLLGAISGAYTEEGLYIHLVVVDDIIFVDSLDRPWEDDNIEILIDPDESHNGRFDGVNDSKYVVELKGDGVAEVVQGAYPTPAEGGDWSRFDAAFLQTDTGYEVEFFFPWEGLQVYPFGEWRMGIEVEINDDDGTGVRESWITLASFDVPNNNTDQYATAELWANKHAVVAPKDEEDVITIDGERDEAYEAGLVFQSSGRPGTLGAPLESETAVRWTALHDDAFLYLHFDITDSAFFTDSGDAYQNDDSLDLFIGGEQDLVLTFQPLADGGVAVNVSGIFPEGPEFNEPEAAYALTDSGWSLEVKVDLAAIGLAGALAGESLALDFQLYDDDDGGDGDYTLTWNAGVGPSSHRNYWGTASFLAPVKVTVPDTVEEILITSGSVETAFTAMPWQEVSRSIEGQAKPLPTNNVFGAQWKAVCDDAFLYLLVEVNDNVMTNEDGIHVVWGEKELWIPARPYGKVIARTPDGDQLDGMETVSWRTDLGYTVKTRMPFAALGLFPHDNTVVSFDLRVIDERGVGETGNIKSWSSIQADLSLPMNRGQIQLNPTLLVSYYGAIRHEGSWYHLPWLGLFNEDSSRQGWVYHEKLQWLYPVALSGEPVWFFSPDPDKWIYIQEDLFPYMWIPGTGWVRYE